MSSDDRRKDAGARPTAPPPGIRLGGTYRLERELGRGGMGVVMLARDTGLEREVAVKVIHGKLAEEESVRALFVTEARAMAEVRHENVVRIYAFGEYEELPYFVMEYVPGPTLADWLDHHYAQRALPSVDESLGILDQLCRGLEAIHAAGIVHADVKPGNVILGPAFRVALTDFGLVRKLGGQDAESIVGTPGYIPPEAVLPKLSPKGLDARADIYALGVIAYELLTGQLPLTVYTLPELFDAHMRGDEPRPPSEVRPELGTAFDEALMASLARHPADRTPTPGDFRKALFAARTGIARRERPMRFLVADDDADFRALVSEALRFAFPSADVEQVSDGQEALAALDRRPASLAVLDLDMPTLNGVEVTAALRADPRHATTPVIVVTATGGAPDWRLLSSLGADGFLVKPVDPYALVTMARRSLDARAKQTERTSVPRV